MLIVLIVEEVEGREAKHVVLLGVSNKLVVSNELWVLSNELWVVNCELWVISGELWVMGSGQLKVASGEQ